MEQFNIFAFNDSTIIESLKLGQQIQWSFYEVQTVKSYWYTKEL